MTDSEENFTFFWSHREGAAHAECSQFYFRPVVLEGLTFNCCEQWMHLRKAVLFADHDVAAAVLIEPSPPKHKAMGRQVTKFAGTTWSAIARDIVFRGNVAKFSQHNDLLQRLRERLPHGKLLVGLWPLGESVLSDKALQREIGADLYVSTLVQSVEACLAEARAVVPVAA